MESFWYLVKVLPGKERSICEQLNQQISLGKINNINRFICPMTGEFVKIKDKKVLREKAIYNGYIYFETTKKLLEDELKNFSNIPNIMSMGGDKKPILLRKDDVNKIIKDEVLEIHNQSKIKTYSVGDTVTIVDGPFSSFNGVITNIKVDKVDVQVKIFGRNTDVLLSLSQIKKN
jgi:transcriptional antiterminator NusG